MGCNEDDDGRESGRGSLGSVPYTIRYRRSGEPPSDAYVRDPDAAGVA